MNKILPYLIKLLLVVAILIGEFQVKAQAIASSTTYANDEKAHQTHKIKVLQNVLNEIESEYNISFHYDHSLIQDRYVEVLPVNKQNKELEETLKELLNPLKLKYQKVDKQIYIIKSEIEEKRSLQRIESKSATPNSNGRIGMYSNFLVGLKPNNSVPMIQDFTVNGKVTNNEGEPIPGVNIILKGTTLGTVTDLEGNYSLRIPSQQATLIFSSIGFVSQEIEVNGSTTINVTMIEDVKSLSEVVVIGYGTAERKDLTGAISSVSGTEIRELTGGATRVDAALQGRVAGVDVRVRDGEPGSAPQITIRGLGSIGAGTEPLYVVDGFPVEDIGTLNMNDVESIDILKDAAATAIYGSRGANGVVMITTKRGQQGKTIISFDAFTGWQSAMMKRDQFNAQQSAQYFYDAMKNRNLDEGQDISGDPTQWPRPVGQEVMDVLEGRNTYDVDPLEYVLRDAAPMQQYSLSASGGNDNLQFALSGEYLTQKGLIIENDMERISFRTNIDAQLSNKLRVSLNLNPSYMNRNRVQASGHASEPNHLSIIGVATTMHNYFPMFEENGDYAKFEGYSSMANLANPVAIAKEIKETEKQSRILGNIRISYDILEDLNFNINLGGNIRNVRESYFRPDIPVFFGTSVFGSDGSTWAQTWLSEYILNYNKTFNKHNLSAIGGFTAQKDRIELNYLESNMYPNNLVQTLNATSQITSGSSSIEEWSLLSYLARFSYNFDSRYYLTASIRTDGSSRFGSNNKWGVFPSIGLTWRILDEIFMENVNFLTDLKLRTSYGETGNNNIGNYAHLPTVNFLTYPTGQGYAPSALANPNLQWEKQRQINAALDVAFFNGRIGLTVEHSRSVSSDLLLNVPVPQITGFSSNLQNIGEVENKGWEVVLNTVNVSKEFSWTTDLNISRYRNIVRKLGPEGAPIISRAHITEVGQPIGMFYGYLFDGIFLNQNEIDQGPLWNPGGSAQSRPGDIRWVDVSGPEGVPDGKIDFQDKTQMGSPYPDFYYGMTNRFAYKNFSLSISFTGSHGNDIIAESYRSIANTRGRFKQVIRNWNYWKSEEQPGDGVTPRPNDAPKGGNREQWSQFHVMDGSYLRINNINFGYTIPLGITQRLGISSLRLYYTAHNPIIFTSSSYNGFNPDVSNSGDALSPGVDLNNYPIPKSHIIGLNLTF